MSNKNSTDLHGSEREDLQEALSEVAEMIIYTIENYEEEIPEERLIEFFRILSDALDEKSSAYTDADSVLRYFCHQLSDLNVTPEIEASFEDFLNKLCTTLQCHLLHSMYMIYAENKKQKLIDIFQKTIKEKTLEADVAHKANRALKK